MSRRPRAALVISLLVLLAVMAPVTDGGAATESVTDTTATPACDRVIPLAQEEVNGASPGEVLCIEPGARGGLELTGLVGTPDAPITVVNGGGVVTIDADGEYAALEIEDSQHVRVTGTGVTAQCGATAIAQQCGIVLSGGGRGIAAKVRPSYLTFDHFEIHDVPGAGVTIKDDVLGRGEWLSREILLTDSYLHDIGDEAVYIGSSEYPADEAHLMNGVHVDRNLVEDTGRDGLQVGSTPWNCTVNGNIVRRVGLNDEREHQMGIIVNRGSACDVIDNQVVDTPRDGIYDQGLHGRVIADNVVVNSGTAEAGAGIDVRVGDQAADNPETPDFPRSSQILGNTVDGASEHGIRLHNADGLHNRIQHNILRNVAGDPIALEPGVSALVSDNVLE